MVAAGRVPVQVGQIPFLQDMLPTACALCAGAPNLVAVWKGAPNRARPRKGRLLPDMPLIGGGTAAK